MQSPGLNKNVCDLRIPPKYLPLSLVVFRGVHNKWEMPFMNFDLYRASKRNVCHHFLQPQHILFCREHLLIGICHFRPIENMPGSHVVLYSLMWSIIYRIISFIMVECIENVAVYSSGRKKVWTKIRCRQIKISQAHLMKHNDCNVVDIIITATWHWGKKDR